MELTFKVMDHVEMGAKELIAYLDEAYRVLYGKPIFLFEGKPYSKSSQFEALDDTAMVMFRWNSIRSAREPMLKICYGYEQMAAHSRAVPMDSITGYDVVDVYQGKKYVGTYRSITIKEGK